MLEKRAESHLSGARFVSCALDFKTHFLFVSMDNACLNTNKKRNNHLLLDEVLRHNWRTDKKRLRYQVAFVRFWKNYIVGKL
jgi:hypothetical protein